MKAHRRIASLKGLSALFLAGSLVASSVGAAPSITRIQPSAITPGRTTLVSFTGSDLAGATNLWTSFPAAVTLQPDSNQTQFQLRLPKETPVGVGAVRVIGTNGMSDLTLVLADPLPTVASAATNHSIASAQPISSSAGIDGACEGLRSDFFRLAAKKGELVTIEVVAQRLGSPLDSWIRLLDEQGRELAANDDAPGLGTDSRIDFRSPKSGIYFLELRDSRYAGSGQHRYRLRIGPLLPTPLPFLSHADLALFTTPLSQLSAATEREPNHDSAHAQSLQTPVEVEGRFNTPHDRDVYEFQAKKGERLVIRGRTRSIGSPCDLFLRLESTNGTRIAEANATGADEGSLTNRFSEAGVYRLVVEELNHGGGPNFAYKLAVQPFAAGFALSTETERVSAPAEESFTIEVRAERRDYDGPIALKVFDPTGTLLTINAAIPAKTNLTKITITSSDVLDLGDSLPFSITGHAIINDAEVTERVSTMPALRTRFPALPHPPRELDGLLMFSVSESLSATPKPPAKKKRK